MSHTLEVTPVNRKKCNRCKVNLLLSNFKVKRNGKLTKICMECNRKTVARRNVENAKDDGSRCEHGKLHYCKKCKGPGICEHNKRTYLCKQCNSPTYIDQRKELLTNIDQIIGSLEQIQTILSL